MIDLPTSSDPLATIIILSHQNQGMLRECLTSIARSVYPERTSYEVIVLFQQSNREGVESFLQDVRGVRAVHAALNLGFGAGNNFAARFANGTYLVFLNDDAITQPGWLDALISTAAADEGVGAVGSRILFVDGRLQEAGGLVWSDASCYAVGRGAEPTSMAYTWRRTVDYASANGMIIRRSVFEGAGGFDTRFFPGYYEDVDLCFTLRHKLGLRVVYEPRSVILHHESATANRDLDFRAFLFKRHQAKMRSKWASVLPSYPAPQPESRVAVEAAVYQSMGNPKRVLVVDDRIPRIGMGSGAGRTADLLNDLASAEYAVTIVPTDPRPGTDNTLCGLGVRVAHETLAIHLSETNMAYDVVIISRPHNYQAFASMIRRAMPRTPIIYDVEALYHRRLLIQAAREPDESRRELVQLEADEMEACEMEIARSADCLVAISDSELEWLSSLDGHAPLHFMRPLSRNIVMGPRATDDRVGAVFVASWLAGERSPNVDALKWYASEVLPLVRATLPNFVTYVSGENPPISVQVMANRWLVLVGLVQNIDDLYNTARIAIAPILAGAGVKIKTIEALQHGVPVVATSVGAEGLGLIDGIEIDVSDDPRAFANRLIALASDDALWRARRQHIEEKISQWEQERVTWDRVVENVLLRPFSVAN